MPAPTLRPIAVGETFIHRLYGVTYTFTRLPDAEKPAWPSEPYVIHAHPCMGQSGHTFEQGEMWFRQRGFCPV